MLQSGDVLAHGRVRAPLAKGCADCTVRAFFLGARDTAPGLESSAPSPWYDLGQFRSSTQCPRDGSLPMGPWVFCVVAEVLCSVIALGQLAG